MYARSTTFQRMPATIHAGIRFIRNKAVPTLGMIAGCRDLSMLVDRGTGCITTSSWDDEATMRASDQQLRRSAIAGGASSAVDAGG